LRREKYTIATSVGESSTFQSTSVFIGWQDSATVPLSIDAEWGFYSNLSERWTHEGTEFLTFDEERYFADFTLASELGCTLDDDCDDDLFCNGGETCFEEQCQDGIPPCIEGEICLEDTDACSVGDPRCGEGDCFIAHALPGCEDESCCNIVCDISPSCCSFSWSEFCAIYADNLCDAAPSGACCVPAVGCVDVDETTCVGFGGDWQGAGVPCNVDTCPDPGPTGACCADDSCHEVTETACSTAGGEWQGAETECVGDICTPDDVGACCLDGVCDVLPEFACVVFGGDWLGAGTVCDGVKCPTSPSCANGDLDGDGDSDLEDFARFQSCLNGPNNVPACD
jgi:hypothetical protein